ncbi:MAG: hypothetical protein LBP92_10625 [Deltaproteobacteria bacterium]|jgi:hypothetical protein|nr:hypothetical protein [Deltaproteobacteria bacterium]
MAEIKTLVALVPEIDPLLGPGRGLLEGGAVFGCYAQGPLFGALGPGREPSIRADGPDEALARIRDGQELTCLELRGPSLGAQLGDLIDQTDRRTVMAIVSPSALAFLGYGISRGAGGPAARASAADVLPTLAQVGEFFLDGKIEGAVLFEALLNPNFKQAQIAKLRAALDRLERMLRRDNREPWDKHDCA